MTISNPDYFDFFIFGPGRSGSTLLSALLSEHPEIGVLNDSFIFDRYAQLMLSTLVESMNEKQVDMATMAEFAAFPVKVNLPSPHQKVSVSEAIEYFHALINRYNAATYGKTRRFEHYYLERLSPNLDNMMRQALNNDLTVRELFVSTYQTIMPDEYSAKRIHGEKTPVHTFYSLWIKELYPKARHIFIIRNPLSNIASIRKYWAGTVERAISSYLSYFRPQLGFLHNPDETFIVRYEDIVNATEQTLNGIFSYLGLSNTSVKTNFDYFMRSEYIGKSVDKSRDSALRNSLDKQEAALIKHHCRPIMERYYPEEVL